MSTVIACHRCDRCGKERPPDPEPIESDPAPAKENGWLQVSIYNLTERSRSVFKTTIPELCRACSDDFIRWFKDAGKTITL